MSRGLVIRLSVATLGGLLVAVPIRDEWLRHAEIRAPDQMLAEIPRRAVAVEPGTYRSYVGVFHLEPHFSITVTEEDGRLFAQGTNQIKAELFPATRTTFFNEYTNALITFQPDEEGLFPRLLLRQPGRLRTGLRRS